MDMNIRLPMEAFEPHDEQAYKNHDQSLRRLQERGGLSVCEAVAILENRSWRRMTTGDALKRLAELMAGTD